jgi:hypothetical protein
MKKEKRLKKIKNKRRATGCTRWSDGKKGQAKG